MGKHLVMVGDDGNVYHIKSSDLGKVAKKVSRDKLSADMQKHVAMAKSEKGRNAVAYILASKADILTASKADILVAGKADILTNAKSDILVSGKSKK